MGVVRRPGRAVLFAVGAMIAAGLFSFSAVQSTTAASAVANTFDELAATRLRVDLPIDTPTYRHLRREQLAALAELDGVESVVVLGESEARLTTVQEPARGVDVDVADYTAIGELSALDDALAGVEPAAGTTLLGGGLASQQNLAAGMRVEIDGVPLRVAGRVDRSPNASSVLFGTVTPADRDALRSVSKGLVLLHVQRGWADHLAPQVAAILNPNRPDNVLVRYPPEAARLRDAVVTRVDGLVLAVATSLLVLSGLVVGIATFAHVLQHRRLIGLRRAIGASGSEIAAGMLADIVVVTGAGAALGTLVGSAAAAAVASASGLTPVLPAVWLLGGIGVAVALNTLAAVPPVVRALRVDPARAIQSR